MTLEQLKLAVLSGPYIADDTVLVQDRLSEPNLRKTKTKKRSLAISATTKASTFAVGLVYGCRNELLAGA